MPVITRENIFKKYQWLEKNNKGHYIMMGDDLDSALSVVLYLHLNSDSKLIGIYNKYKELYFSKKHFKSYEELINSQDVTWIDLDINNKHCKSLGHHIIRYDKYDNLIGFNNSCNLNELLKRSVVNKFSKKYPLGTIHFLLWLYDENIPNSKYADKLIWLADSAFINSQSHRFRSNAGNWITNIFPHKQLINSFQKKIEKKSFEIEMESLQKKMESNGFNKGSGQVCSKHLKLTGFQCQPKKIPCDIEKLLNYVAKLTNWQYNIKQIELKNLIKISGARTRKKVNNLFKNHKDLDHFLKNKTVFSYVFPFKRMINYTIF